MSGVLDVALQRITDRRCLVDDVGKAGARRRFSAAEIEQQPRTNHARESRPSSRSADDPRFEAVILQVQCRGEMP